MSTKDTATNPSSTEFLIVTKGSIFDPTDDDNTVQKTIKGPWETARTGLHTSIEALAGRTAGNDTAKTMEAHLKSLDSLSKKMEQHMSDTVSLINQSLIYGSLVGTGQTVSLAFTYHLFSLASECRNLVKASQPFQVPVVQTDLTAPPRALYSPRGSLSPSTGSLSTAPTPTKGQRGEIERCKTAVLRTLDTVNGIYSGFAKEIEDVEKALRQDGVEVAGTHKDCGKDLVGLHGVKL